MRRLLKSTGFDLLGAVIVSIGASGSALAGAWTVEDGRGQAIVTGLYSAANDRFPDAYGPPSEATDFEKGSLSVLVEYGLTDAVTLLGEGEVGAERDGDLPFARPGLSSLAAGARVRLLERNGAVLSAQVAGRIEDAHGAADEGVETLGWTALQAEGRILAGYGFKIAGRDAFVEGQAGYRRGFAEDGTDEIRLDATFGLRLRPDLLALAQTFSTLSTEEADGAQPYEYHKVQGSMVYDVSERWSLQAGGFATIGGRNALKEHGLISAVWFRF